MPNLRLLPHPNLAEDHHENYLSPVRAAAALVLAVPVLFLVVVVVVEAPLSIASNRGQRWQTGVGADAWVRHISQRSLLSWPLDCLAVRWPQGAPRKFVMVLYLHGTRVQVPADMLSYGGT